LFQEYKTTDPEVIDVATLERLEEKYFLDAENLRLLDEYKKLIGGIQNQSNEFMGQFWQYLNEIKQYMIQNKHYYDELFIQFSFRATDIDKREKEKYQIDADRILKELHEIEENKNKL
jgi:hypothetical protein